MIKSNPPKVFRGGSWKQSAMFTADNMVYMGGTTETLREQWGELMGTVTALLAATNGLDVNTILAHLAANGIHLSQEQVDKLTNLDDDANTTYASKTYVDAAVAGKKSVEFYTDIQARDDDIVNFTEDDSGTLCWVQDPSDDLVNIPPGKVGAAQYMWDGTAWQFLFQAGDMDLEWDAILGKPNSSPAAIDAAVAKAHEHSFVDTDVETAITNSHVHTTSVADIETALSKVHEHTSALSAIENAVAKTHEHANATTLDILDTNADDQFTFNGLPVQLTIWIKEGDPLPVGVPEGTIVFEEIEDLPDEPDPGDDG